MKDQSWLRICCHSPAEAKPTAFRKIGCWYVKGTAVAPAKRDNAHIYEIAVIVRDLLRVPLAIQFNHEVERRSTAFVAMLVMVAVVALLMLLGTVKHRTFAGA